MTYEELKKHPDLQKENDIMLRSFVHLVGEEYATPFRYFDCKIGDMSWGEPGLQFTQKFLKIIYDNWKR